MSTSALSTAIDTSVKKADMLKNDLKKFWTKAMLAGVYISFAVVFAFRIGDAFRATGSPATSLIGGMTFSLALVLIVIGGGELFTGNTMYMTMGSLDQKTSLKETLYVWGVTYLGNLIGVLFFTFLFVQTGLFKDIPADHYLFSAVTGKIGLTTGEMFFRGILCNWLVCLAIWLPLQTDNFAAKVMLIMMTVTSFFVSGYEHSIANMALFSISLSVPHPDTITLTGAAFNLLIVSLGNIVGGGLFVGAANWYVNKQGIEKEVTVYAVDEKQEVVGKVN
ncbi:formate/nitrite transporter family protein [Caldifermentibacillus hisashii]|uniref:formate/nitrite transporter family protein n=1 Tax=Caldifermentibacillus hisashii TaxID=996558 RepID=UPI0034D5C951